MSNMPLTDGINALIRYANETTGASDTTLSDAVESLAAGYGGGGGVSVEDMATGNGPTGEVALNGVSVIDHAFQGRKGITKVVLLNIQRLGRECFADCSNIASFWAPDLTHLNGLGNLSSANLTIVDFPKLTYIQSTSFMNNKNLRTIILRASSICSLANSNALQDTPFKGYGGLTGTLYAPSALVESYKTASKWCELYNAGTMTVLPIEGSIYETQYADGTPIT